MLASALALSLALPPVPPGPPGVAPIVIEAGPSPRAQARVQGRVQAEGEAALDLSTVSLELECSGGCGRPAARVRPDLSGAFELWRIEPGRHRLTLHVGPRSFVHELELAPGEERVITLVVPEVEPPPPSLPASRPSAPPQTAAARERMADPGQPLRRGGLAATIVGSTMGVGALLFATLVPCGKDGTRGADCDVDVRNTVALAMGLASAGTLTAGLVALGLGRAQRREHVSAGVALQRGGGGLVVLARF